MYILHCWIPSVLTNALWVSGDGQMNASWSISNCIGQTADHITSRYAQVLDDQLIGHVASDIERELLSASWRLDKHPVASNDTVPA